MPSTRPTRRRLVAVTGVWVLLLGVIAYLGARTGPPTAREQVPLARARATVDRVLAEVATAAGPEVVAAVSAYETSPGCRVTSARHGTELTGVIRLYTGVGAERALLDRLAAALPPGYRDRVLRPSGPAGPGFYADAGDFVAVRGTVSGPGEVRLSAEAGCRPGDDLGAGPAVDPPGPAQRAALDGVLAALGTRPAQRHTHQVPCPGGGVLRTEEATGPAAGAGPLPDRLRPVAGTGTVVLSQPQRYAYRPRPGGPVAVAVRVQADTVTVTATTVCS